jgi:hypothetical protein
LRKQMSFINEEMVRAVSPFIVEALFPILVGHTAVVKGQAQGRRTRKLNKGACLPLPEIKKITKSKIPSWSVSFIDNNRPGHVRQGETKQDFPQKQGAHVSQGS